MPKQIEFEGTVHEFPDDFTDEDIAAALGGAPDLPPAATAGMLPPNTVEQQAPERPSPSMVGPAIFAGMKAMPGIVSGINAAAKAAGGVASSQVGRYAPGVVVLDAAGRLVKGDYKGAATSTATAAAMSQAPRVASAIARATTPTSGVMKGASWALKPGMGGGLTKAAGVMSRAAGPLSIAYEAIFGDGKEGHRPPGETPEITRSRQDQFAREYQQMVNAKEPGAITGTTTDELLASIARYRNR